MEKKIIKQTVPCNFSDGEKLALANEMSQACTRIRRKLAIIYKKDAK